MGRAQDSQSGPSWPPPDEGEAGMPTTRRWLREDGWALGWGSRQTHPILWLQEASGHVWLICSSRAPSPRGGGEAPGA